MTMLEAVDAGAGNTGIDLTTVVIASAHTWLASLYSIAFAAKLRSALPFRCACVGAEHCGFRSVRCDRNRRFKPDRTLIGPHSVAHVPPAPLSSLPRKQVASLRQFGPAPDGTRSAFYSRPSEHGKPPVANRTAGTPTVFTSAPR
ncbi:hypothetical protein I6G56_02035 [Burkholderia humptydooensis]|uniref:Uncharacterized protein n=2 Tax=Burkholderia humptydooensis TaxID=430531 RepID=A0A7T2U1D6_9BURK|nr:MULTISPECIES: hypothetical protein [Burkholderia]QPS43912.1 hypothetical protein I6G56_02035 [Burkholderia humptydooensis]